MFNLCESWIQWFFLWLELSLCIVEVSYSYDSKINQPAIINWLRFSANELVVPYDLICFFRKCGGVVLIWKGPPHNAFFAKFWKSYRNSSIRWLYGLSGRKPWFLKGALIFVGLEAFETSGCRHIKLKVWCLSFRLITRLRKWGQQIRQ